MRCRGPADRDDRADAAERFAGSHRWLVTEASRSSRDVTCPSGGSENPTTNRFCGGCGGAPARGRPSRAPVKPPDHPLCRACVASLVAPLDRITKPGHEVGGAGNVVARKIVTGVFADLIGSTALHERLDAESVRSLMGRYYGRDMFIANCKLVGSSGPRVAHTV